MPEGWISVCGWRSFQHYDPLKRQPPWIKSYTELLADEEYLSLPGHTRSVLHGVWLAYASSRCRLRADARSLSSRLRLRVTEQQLVSLSDAGFIEFVASAALAEGYHGASTALASRAPARSQETETEVETEEHLAGKQASTETTRAAADDEPEPGLPASREEPQEEEPEPSLVDAVDERLGHVGTQAMRELAAAKARAQEVR